MSITPITIILIFVYLKLLMTKDKKKSFLQSFVLAMIFSIVVYMGFFIDISGKTVPYNTVSWLFCSYFAFSLNLNRKSDVIRNYCNRHKIYSIFFLISLFITLSLFYINRYQKPIIENSDYAGFLLNEVGYVSLSSSSYKYGFLYLSIMLCYVLYTCHRHLCLADFIYIGRLFIKISTVSIVLGYFEFILENIFGSLFITDASLFLFGESGAQQVTLTLDRGLSNIQVFTREASMYSTSLFYSNIVLINLLILDKKVKQYYRYFFATLILMILNRSMSSYVYAFFLLFLIAYLRPFSKTNDGINRKSIIWFLVLIIVLFTSPVLLGSDNYLSLRINESISQMANVKSQDFSYGSEGIRYLGILQCLLVFTDRPLFGIGYGCITCVSGIATMLSNIGIFGLISYMLVIKPHVKIKKIDLVIMMALVVVLPNILLNDLNSMFSLLLPLASVLTAYSIQIKSSNLGDKTTFDYQSISY